MSKLTYIRQLDELIVGLLEVTNPNSVEGNSKLFFEQQKKNNDIYYAPILNGKTQEVHSHYACGIIRIHKNNEGEYYPIYYNPDLRCELLGDNYQDSTNKEKIAYSLSRLTLDDNIARKINTQDRLELWLYHKDFIYRFASCFLMEKELLEEEYKNATITKNLLDIIYNYYKVHYELYKIIDCKWLKIKKEFKVNKKFFFNSSLELFLEILCKKMNYEYTKFLSPQIKLSAKDKFKAYKLFKDIASYRYLDKITPYEKKRLIRKNKELNSLTAPNKYTHYWERKIEDFLLSKYEKDKHIQAYFHAKEMLGKDIHEIMKSRKFPKPPNCMMINGVIDKGSDWRSRNGQVNPARKPNKT